MQQLRGRNQNSFGGIQRGRSRDRRNGQCHGERESTIPSRHETPSQDANDQADTEVNAHILERFRNEPDGRTNHSGNNWACPTVKLNPLVAKYAEDQDSIIRNAAQDDWREIPEIPEPSELLLDTNTTVALPPNRINEPWTKRDRYLKAHYKLLREDATASLREALDKFREDTLRMDDNETHIYEQVHICGFTFTHKGIAARIKFSTIRAGRKILWASSKRLTSGNLVVLSSDDFDAECIPAIVAARPIQNLEINPPEIDIFFSDPETIEIDSQKSFVMIEATQGYFEAYRHTLLALQKQSKETFPLAEHICFLQQEIDAPNYLISSPHRDLSPIASAEMQTELSNVNILKAWPPSKDGVLDNSQWAAMRQLLTKRLAIIQGPPGTGKTHISKMGLEILVKNRKPDDPPIIVACQTNHALDQLLCLTANFDPNYIRLGGRSTNVDVKKRALFEVRKTTFITNVPGSCYSKAKKALASETMKLQKVLSILCDPSDGETTSPIAAEDLERLEVISGKQRQSLEKGASQWVRSSNMEQNAIETWLGKSLYPFKVFYAEDEFGFEAAEEDLEIEQLQELEAEHGVMDEEDLEMLKGDFVALSKGWTVAKSPPHVINQAKDMLDTCDDLWEVPERLRGPMYIIMQQKVKSLIKIKFCDIAKEYMSATKQLQIGKWERDSVYLAKANIIGCTNSGLAKYRNLLASLRPKIVMIEEASEVLEGAVTAGCMESLEHLILVGDHLQLQANCSVRELGGEPYWLNISMFERLVRNHIPHKTLLRQRRMDPDFRRLIHPVYPELEDHESVIGRAIVPWGMGQVRSYFFNHDFHEMQDESMSTFNEYEARMVAKFYRHLIRNGVPAAAITVLTFYNGQRKKILKELKNDEETLSDYNKVKTVDSYQGEENHIILLSLVRHNSAGRIGFLNINNRIVVALSRAKYGFYLFGNGGFLAEHNELWDTVEVQMYKAGQSGKRLPITCTTHGNTIFMEHPEDFDDTHGGCKQTCGDLLGCGHKCPLKCHPYSHNRIVCHATCEKILVCRHKCVKQCNETCTCECEIFQQHVRDEQNPTRSEVSRSKEDLRHQDPHMLDAVRGVLAHTAVARNANQWEQFATGGGAMNDDKRTAEAYNAARIASWQAAIPKKQGFDQSEAQSGAVLTETQETTARGRSRFVQNYQPAVSEEQQLTDRMRNLTTNKRQKLSTTPSTKDANLAKDSDSKSYDRW